MLVLTRKVGEQIVVPECQLTLTVLGIVGSRVRLGVSAPREMTVHRQEVQNRTVSDANPAAGVSFESVRSARILLADADQFLLTSYSTQLRQRDAIPLVARTGLECLEMLREVVPDVLVLAPELLWGGADGILALMAEQPALRPPIVMLLTHNRNRTLLYRLSSFKVDDYQLKPMTAVQLMGRICTMLACRGAPFGLATRETTDEP
jgi:carbon storage regulator